MCKSEYAVTSLAKQKHAEFMLKMAEIIYGIVLTGALGTSVLYWFNSKETQTDGTFRYYIILTVAGVVGAIYSQYKAMAIFNQPAGKAENDLPLPATALLDITNPLAIHIQHGATQISIHIQPEKNNA